MSRYRIAKNTQGDRVWYTLQKYNWFFGLRWWSDVEFYSGVNYFINPDDVQKIINAGLLPVITEPYEPDRSKP